VVGCYCGLLSANRKFTVDVRVGTDFAIDILEESYKQMMRSGMEQKLTFSVISRRTRLQCTIRYDAIQYIHLCSEAD